MGCLSSYKTSTFGSNDSRRLMTQIDAGSYEIACVSPTEQHWYLNSLMWSQPCRQWKKKDGSLMCLETPDMFTFVCATFLQYLSYHSLFSLPRCQIQRAVQWRLASKADATALQTLITCSSAGLVQRDEDKKSLDRRYSWRLDVSLIPQFQPKWAECRFKVDSTC